MAEPPPPSPPSSPASGGRGRGRTTARRGVHPAWPIAIVTAGALLAASAFRSTTGVLIEPIMSTTGWPLETVAGAASLNLVVYGIATPFAAAIMQVWGVRRTVVTSLGVVAVAAALTSVMTQTWHLWTLWGVCIGLGTGALALTFGTIVANRWFAARRNLVTGIFSAATAAGAAVFAVACAVVLRDRPADLGVEPYGADRHDGAGAGGSGGAGGAGAGRPAGPGAGAAPLAAAPEGSGPTGEETAEGPLRAAFRVLGTGARRWSFWALLLSFAVCGWATNGIVVTHLVPAAHDHAMPATTAAWIIGILGVFDIIGTIASGWLTDRIDPRALLAFYYVTRGISLVFFHDLLGPGVDGPLWVWIIFYGLDWTATVPPTVALCREVFGLEDSGVAFGWVYAAHMIGAGIGAHVSGLLRAGQGTYEWAWVLSAVLCIVAGVLAVTIRRGTGARSVVSGSRAG